MLQEEMRRVLASHEHKAEWWRKRQDGLGCVWLSVDHAEGARAYASRQAAMHEELMAHCKLVWSQERKRPPSPDVPAPQETSDVAAGHANPDFDSKDSSSDNGGEDSGEDGSEGSSEYVGEDVEDLY